MAKYISVNELDTFHFHDAILDRLSFEGNDMVWHVRYLGVVMANTQNRHLTDMTIKEAKVMLHDIEFTPFYHPNTGILPATTPEELFRLFLDAGQTVFSYFFSAPSDEQGRQCGNVEWMLYESSIIDFLFDFSVRFSRLTVEWDEFDGPAYWVRPS